MNNLYIDEAIGYLHQIIDNVRCATCDKLEGARLRYPCGHSVCIECSYFAENCQSCTPTSSDSPPQPDYPLTQAVKHAANLLKECQNYFNFDDFHRKRIFNQLRVEKELFPKCIQAPHKYENKRKSINVSMKSKENSRSTFLPGEAISSPKCDMMENFVKRDNVQQWLNKHGNTFCRKPFANLNVNTPKVHSPKSKKKYENANDNNVSLDATRKRTHYKIKKDESEITPKKVMKNSCASSHYNTIPSDFQKKCDNDESGICMEGDLIVINDSQETVIDKDNNAWLAVLQACQNEDLDSTSLPFSSQDICNNDADKQLINVDLLDARDVCAAKVPFIKRSPIIETCRFCKNEVILAEPMQITAPMKPVTITINSDSFVTTITVLKTSKDIEYPIKKSVLIQTDSCTQDQGISQQPKVTNTIESHDCKETDNFVNTAEKAVIASDTHSEDLFADDQKIFGADYEKSEISKWIVIEESDSDSDLEVSGTISVKADVHRACEKSEYGILTEISNVNEQSAQRRGLRGPTPTSTDSSEKENYNPNRMKRRITGKKKHTKKKN